MANSNYQKGQFLVVPNKSVVLKLRGAALNVYLAIVDHADDNGKCFPSYNRIIEVTDYKRRQVIEAMAQLVEIGLLKKNGRARHDGSQTSNEYAIQLIHTRGVPERTAWGVPERTPASEPERTPINSTQIELYPSNSKEWSFKQKREYAKACERDRALERRQTGRASPSNEGSFGSVVEVMGVRPYVQKSLE